MGQVLHGSAKTTHAVRAELQRSHASAAELARRFRINEKTVRKWRSRRTVEDEPMDEIGYFHLDIAELRCEGGEAYLFVAVERTSKLVFAEIYRGRRSWWRRASSRLCSGLFPTRYKRC